MVSSLETSAVISVASIIESALIVWLTDTAVHVYRVTKSVECLLIPLIGPVTIELNHVPYLQIVLLVLLQLVSIQDLRLDVVKL